MLRCCLSMLPPSPLPSRRDFRPNRGFETVSRSLQAAHNISALPIARGPSLENIDLHSKNFRGPRSRETAERCGAICARLPPFRRRAPGQVRRWCGGRRSRRGRGGVRGDSGYCRSSAALGGNSGWCPWPWPARSLIRGDVGRNLGRLGRGFGPVSEAGIGSAGSGRGASSKRGFV